MTGGSQGGDGPDDGGTPGHHGQSDNEGEDIAVDQLLASLRVIAKEEQIKTDGQIAPLVSPLSADERGQIAAAILAAQRPGQGVVTPLAPRRTNRRRWIAAVVPLAAAASLVFVLRGRSDSSRDWPALPAYEVSARGGIKEYRHGGPESTDSGGATTRPERVSRNSELVVTCRPQTAVEGPLAARAFLIQQDGAAREIAAQVQIAPSGAAEVRFRPFDDRMAAANVPVGRWMVRVAVGRSAAVTKLVPTDAAGSPGDAPAWRWLTVPIDLVAE